MTSINIRLLIKAFPLDVLELIDEYLYIDASTAYFVNKKATVQKIMEICKFDITDLYNLKTSDVGYYRKVPQYVIDDIVFEINEIDLSNNIDDIICDIISLIITITDGELFSVLKGEIYYKYKKNIIYGNRVIL